MHSSDFEERVRLTTASPQQTASSANYRHRDNDVEANLFGASDSAAAGQSLDNNNVPYQTRIIQRDLRSDSPRKTQRTERDIAAMSVASMYDDENKEMDSDK